MIQLDSIVQIRYSPTYPRSEEGDYPCYTNGKFHRGRTNRFNVEANQNTVIIPRARVNMDIYMVQEKSYYMDSYILTSRDENVLLNKYLYIYLKYVGKDELRALYTGVAMVALRKDDLRNFEIPVPSLEVQNVWITRYDAYVNRLNELQNEVNEESTSFEAFLTS